MKPVLEQIHVDRRQSISAFRHVKQNFEMPWHFHPQHELTYIEESRGTKFIGDFVGSYEPGELVLLRANLPHCWKNHIQEHGQSISTVIQWEKGIFGRVGELKDVFAMLRDASKGLLFNKKETHALIPLVKKLPDYTGATLYVKVLEVLVQLSGYSYTILSESHFLDNLPMEHSSRISRIHDFVEAEYGRKIYLKEVADLVNMSEQSFSRFFSKMMGRPFFTFLNEYRINVAGRMLIDTDWSVAQISYACGYESLPFFHKQFNKFKEVSPSRFRKRYMLA